MGLVNKLEQLSKYSTVVADTGAIEDIKLYAPQDATTNPSLLLKAAQIDDYKYIFEKSVKPYISKSIDIHLASIIMDIAVGFGVEILEIIPGRVSTEVDARLSFDTKKTIEYAKEIINKYHTFGVDRDRVLIKIAATWEGIMAASELEKSGIHCNLTLIFNKVQAIASANSRASLVSPFVGRVTDWYMKKNNLSNFPEVDIDPGVYSVKDIYRYFKFFGYDTMIMGASFRHILQVEALAGCDALTISPGLLKKLESNYNPLSNVLKGEIYHTNLVQIDTSKQNFEFLMKEDIMAYEKLAEGIKQFSVDTLKLESLVKDRLR